MQFDKFDRQFTNTMQAAKEIAVNLNQQLIDPLYLLKAMVEQADDTIQPVFQRLGVNLSQLANTIDENIAQLPKVYDTGMPDPVLSSELQRILSKSLSETKTHNNENVDSKHVILAMSESMDKVGRVLRQYGVCRDSLTATLGNQQPEWAHWKSHEINHYPTLTHFGRDLTAFVKQDSLGHIIGRDEEINQVIQILMRHKKHNPILVGESGVGKTAIIEGLAKRIATDCVPVFLKNKRIVAVDITNFLAKSKLHSSLENRLETFLEEIEAIDQETILFLDELHTLFNADAPEVAQEVLNQLKPVLLNGQLYCIGISTTAAYNKQIENDPVLGKCFQRVNVSEPTLEETSAILHGLKKRYETHHGVIIQDSAVTASVVLSHRYLKNRYFPDKAIDLLDEAAARLRSQIDRYPNELIEIKGRIRELENEKQALKKENSKVSVKHRQKINSEITRLTKEHASLQDHWRQEIEFIENIRQLQGAILTKKQQYLKIKNKPDLNQEEEQIFEQLQQLEAELAETVLKLQKVQKKKRIIKITVDEDEIAEVLSKWTGIPAWLLC